MTDWLFFPVFFLVGYFGGIFSKEEFTLRDEVNYLDKQVRAQGLDMDFMKMNIENLEAWIDEIKKLKEDKK